MVGHTLNSIEDCLARFGSEKGHALGLENFARALEAFGNPHRNVQSIVISGTNGKGSTTLFISSILREAGYRVATYLSPHLQSVTERMLWNLVPIEHGDLSQLARQHVDQALEMKLSYFEFLTLLFFLNVKEKQPDWIVLEVGLGGRLDATNVTTPKACVLTNISRDHEAYLGAELSQILGEKLGILRKGVPLISGILQPELETQARSFCEKMHSEYLSTQAFPIQELKTTWEGNQFALEGHSFSTRLPFLGAVESARNAYALTRRLLPHLSAETVRNALARVRNPGRFERVSEQPVVILSGDHNLAGVANLCDTLKKLPPRNLRILCAFSPDKPFAEMYAQLRELDPKLLLTQVPHLSSKLPPVYFQMGPFEPELRAAVRRLLSELREGEGLLITGSLYLIGEVRSLWKHRVTFVDE